MSSLRPLHTMVRLSDVEASLRFHCHGRSPQAHLGPRVAGAIPKYMVRVNVT